jgi:hypothetical protein
MRSKARMLWWIVIVISSIAAFARVSLTGYLKGLSRRRLSLTSLTESPSLAAGDAA